MTIKEALNRGIIELKAKNVTEPSASAEVLLSDVLTLNRTQLLTKGEQELTKAQFKKYQKYLTRRTKHEPVWQIIGKVDFWGMQYAVTKDVLVPRPETEILVQKVVEYAKSQKRALKILDLGTGSGTIIIALQTELENCSFFASDLSGKALRVAKKNAKILTKKGSIEFKKGNLFAPWKEKYFDIIVANLPYIPHEDMPSLALDVYHYEPRLALDGGRGGLEIYEEFFREVPSHLDEHGAIFCEIGIEQGEQFKKMVKKYLPGAKCEILGDLAGIDRVAIIKK